MILKILATYRSHEGAQRIVRAARQSFKPEDYLWHVIFRALSAPDHPEQGFVFEQLRDRLPHGSIAGALLDGANRTAIAGGTIRHPFDSPAGHAQLGVWLADTPEHGLAQSATAALPFIAPPACDSLLAAAMAHQDEAVRLEAAWAAAKLGDEAGIEALTEVCLEVNRSVIARRYLSELERRDAIPRAALEPDFLARAEFANWLSHPNELGRYPDEVEILDSRHLGWPPEHENKQCWVLRYRVLDSHGLGEEARGCGMVGSVTFCLFSYEMHLRPPEDAYAIHCAWEMKRSRLIRTLEPDKPDEYEGALKHWKGEPLSAVQILRVAELSPRLGAGSDVLTLASAHLSGAAGWVVLDGARSAWYPASGMPEDAPASTVLDLHIGRRLLGFTDRPDRQRWLSEGSPIEPDNLVRAWERLQSQASEQPNPDLSDQVSALAKHVDAYADSCATVRNETRSSAFIRGFEQILDLARSNADALGDDAFSTFGPLGKKLEAYVAASLEAGSHDAVASIVEFLTPHWDHNSGYGTLGAWLFHAGLHEKAERFFLKLRESYQDWQRSEQMSLLARIGVG